MVVREALGYLLAILRQPVTIRKPLFEVETFLDKPEQLLRLVTILECAYQVVKALHLHIILLLIVVHFV